MSFRQDFNTRGWLKSAGFETYRLIKVSMIWHVKRESSSCPAAGRLRCSRAGVATCCIIKIATSATYVIAIHKQTHIKEKKQNTSNTPTNTNKDIMDEQEIDIVSKH